MKILVLHGINLDMFGKREPALYGTTTLAEIDAQFFAEVGEMHKRIVIIDGEITTVHGSQNIQRFSA